MGVTILIVLGAVVLSQLVLQGTERRRQHRELLDRLTAIEAQITQKQLPDR